MRDDAVLGRALPLDRGLGPWKNGTLVWEKCSCPNGTSWKIKKNWKSQVKVIIICHISKLG